MKENFDWLSKETSLWEAGYKFIAGVDEAGRGPLAGPVVAAAVILKRGENYRGIDDSKKLSALQREKAFELIMNKSLAVAISASSVTVIDRINILWATMRAMERAVERLKIKADYVLIDGNRIPKGIAIQAESIIGGDACCRSIAAASIVAKVVRDRLMCSLDKFYPQYGFAEHKGYSTKGHILAINTHGPTAHHRFSFAPVRQTSLGLNND
ncbi:ribonuclease HII [bacterium]|nr:ribonuclease HII [bacterium]